MTRTKPLLDKLASMGKPLVEACVEPIECDQSYELADALDSLAEDISAAVRSAYLQPAEGAEQFQIYMEATQEALFRDFGWELVREKYYDSSEHDGKFPDGYFWKEITRPKYFPKSLFGKIANMGLVQPGNSDNGLKDEVVYDFESATGTNIK